MPVEKKGAAGAAAGAAVGSIVPGIGTAIGAGVGALVGRRQMKKDKKEAKKAAAEEEARAEAEAEEQRKQAELEAVSIKTSTKSLIRDMRTANGPCPSAHFLNQPFLSKRKKKSTKNEWQQKRPGDKKRLVSSKLIFTSFMIQHFHI